MTDHAKNLRDVANALEAMQPAVLAHPDFRGLARMCRNAANELDQPPDLNQILRRAFRMDNATIRHEDLANAVREEAAVATHDEWERRLKTVPVGALWHDIIRECTPYMISAGIKAGFDVILGHLAPPRQEPMVFRRYERTDGKE